MGYKKIRFYPVETAAAQQSARTYASGQRHTAAGQA